MEQAVPAPFFVHGKRLLIKCSAPVHDKQFKVQVTHASIAKKKGIAILFL